MGTTGTWRPLGRVVLLSRAVVPLMEACTGALTKALASPTTSPAVTLFLGLTVASHGAPMCCNKGMRTLLGVGSTSMAASATKCLPSGG